MEENMAILMVDLSGYTALTETHGSASAADLIDQYIKIANSCLVGDCRLHERSGDQVMILSPSPDFLLKTALLIGHKTSHEENFLEVHGGLHFGKVLKRGDSYFGSAINLTARIASQANAGTLCCSSDFVQAITNKFPYKMRRKGMFQFKNISEEKEIFELNIHQGEPYYIDPVCRMLIRNLNHAVPHPFEKQKYFCSNHC